MSTEKPDDPDGEELRIPIVEEIAHVDVRDLVTGRLRVRTATEMQEVEVERDLQRNTVEVERVSVGRWIGDDEAFPSVRTEGDVTVVPVIEEVLVVERRFRLVEEVRITSRETTETFQTPVRLRRQRVIVERAGPDGVFHPETPDSED